MCFGRGRQRFAPMLSYITEEIWSWVFAEETGYNSIHTPWPNAVDFEKTAQGCNPAVFDTAVACMTTVHKTKTQAGVSMTKPIERLTLTAHLLILENLRPALADVSSAIRTENYTLKTDDELEKQQIVIEDIQFHDSLRDTVF